MPRRKSTGAAERSAIATARFVLDEKLDIAGFNPHGIDVREVAYGDGDVVFVVEIVVTQLDIEMARREGK